MFSKGDQYTIEYNFPTLVNFTMQLVTTDYNYKPVNNEGHQWAKGSDESMMYLITLSSHISYIISCHLPEMNQGWVRTYDSWYTSREDLGRRVFIAFEPAVAVVRCMGVKAKMAH